MDQQLLFQSQNKHVSFDQFKVFNDQIDQQIQRFLNIDQWQSLSLCGVPSSGKTHLLKAAINSIHNHQQAVYLNFSQIDDALLEELLPYFSTLKLLCIDDLAIDNNREKIIYSLYEQAKIHQVKIICSMASAPTKMQFSLADLTTRMSVGLVLTLPDYDDYQKKQIITYRCQLMGMKLGKDEMEYIFNHHSRDLAVLMSLVNKLADASLVYQRKISIPLIKSLTHS